MPMIGIGLDLSGQGSGGVPLEEAIAYDYLPPNDNSSGNSVRVHVFDLSGLDAPDFTVQGVRLEIAGSLDAVYIGQQAAAGDAYDAESLVQIFFSGSPSIVQAFDATTLSDFAEFSWDKTTNLLVSSLGSSGNQLPSDASAVVSEYSAGVLLAAEVGVADKSTGQYSSDGGIVRGVSKIILYGN